MAKNPGNITITPQKETEYIDIPTIQKDDFNKLQKASRYNFGALKDWFSGSDDTYFKDYKQNGTTVSIRLKNPSLWDRIRGKKPEFISISGAEPLVKDVMSRLKIVVKEENTLVGEQSIIRNRKLEETTTAFVNYTRVKYKKPQQATLPQSLTKKKAMNIML